MSQKPQKWTEERTAVLTKFVSDIETITQDVVAEAAAMLETTTRSVAAKLRKMGMEVEKVENTHVKSFSEEQEEALRTFLADNEGVYTFAEVADHFADGAFTAKQIQGKVLSMELTDLVKKTPKKAYERSFTAAEEATFIKMARADASMEAIAEALGRDVPVIRGKALSLTRSGEIDAMPRSEKIAVKAADPFATIETSDFTVAELAEKLERSERGIKTMLTRRGLSTKDYNGAGKREKRDAVKSA